MSDRSMPARANQRQKSRQQKSRKLHLGHIAFMRAVVQGLDTYESWNRYLRIEGEHQDRKLVNRTVQWIRDEFAAAAKRHARPGTARLVRIDTQRSDPRQAEIPTLEEFANDNGLAGFSEAEQLEHFIARYGRQSTRQNRRSRLIAKQLAALDWLEQLVAEPPRQDDPVDAWLHPDLAGHLKSARIKTLKQLADRINGLGHQWSSAIPAIGRTKAARIVDWLRLHAPSTGLPIGVHAGIPRKRLDKSILDKVVAPVTAVVPLEKLIIPAELDGRAGEYRQPGSRCRIPADDDREAIVFWLRSKSGNHTVMDGMAEEAPGAEIRGISPLAQRLTHTQRAYWKEAERFMLWAVVLRKKALSSMNVQDCEAYVAFLESPSPAEQWCGPRSRERWSPLWRPFEGPLSFSARRQTIVILKNLYRFLEENQYLSTNPWSEIRLPRSEPAVVESRSFTPVQWRYLEQQLDLLPPTSVFRRLRVAMRLFYETGLPLNEALDARVGQIRISDSEADGEITAKAPHFGNSAGSNPERQASAAGIAVSSRLGKELSDYLQSRGLHPDIAHPGNRHVYVLGKGTDAGQRAPWSPEHIIHPDLAAGISANTLYLQIKAFFKECAQAIAPLDAEAAKRFAAAGTQWLRRTHDMRRREATLHDAGETAT